MNKVLLVTAAAAALGLAACTADEAAAAEVNGEISLDFTENASGDIVAAKEIELGVEAAAGVVASVGLIEDNGDIKLDSYAVGVEVNEMTVSFGDQGDLMEAFEGNTEAVGGQTLTDLNDDYESIQVQVKGIGVMVGFDDVTSDVSEIKNVQVAAGTEIGKVSVVGAVNWDEATDDITVGLNGQINVQNVNVGGTLTYTEAVTGYEASAGYKDFSVFINGDDTDMTQNVGGGYYGSMENGLNFYAEAGYNLDSKELTPAAGISFKF